MTEHDPRCENLNDEKVLSDVKEYGWHVDRVLDTDEVPAWAFSIGLFKNFKHPEIVVFGLELDLMHFVINSVGDDIKAGKKFEIDGQYADLIDSYSCIFKPVQRVWYEPFLGYANWFYYGTNYPVLQCLWPDRDHRYPWEPKFNPDWVWAQPLLFHKQLRAARTKKFLDT